MAALIITEMKNVGASTEVMPVDFGLCFLSDIFHPSFDSIGSTINNTNTITILEDFMITRGGVGPSVAIVYLFPFFFLSTNFELN